MSSRSWIRTLFARTPVRPSIKRRPRLAVEALEDRAVPATFSVTSTLDDGTAGTLRWAVAQANSTAGADTITFAPAVAGGTITLDPTLGQLALSDADRTTIDGGAAGVTLDGNHASRVVLVNGGATATLDHLTLTHGRGVDKGAGILSAGNLTVRNCSITDNEVNTDVGVDQVYGGGVFQAAGSLTLIDSTVAGNTAQDNVGGGAFGGGIFQDGGALTLTRSTVSGNRAQGPDRAQGGGIATGGAAGSLTLTSTTVAGNTAAGGQSFGGGVYHLGGAVTLANSTVAGNTANGGVGGDSGGGIYNAGSAVTLTDTIVAHSFGGDLGNPDRYVGTNALIGSGSGPGVYPNLAGVLVADPLFDPAGLQNNGGPTKTIALLPGSPAIGAGPFAAAYAAIDQRGFARPAAGNIDIGAYQTTAGEPASLVVTTTADALNAFDGLTSLREAVAYANAHLGTDTITFAPGVAGGTITLAGGQLELTDGTRTTIDGGAAGVTIDGADATRVLQVNSGATATLAHLTIAHGYVNGPWGGGILNYGDLAITDSTLFGNRAIHGNGGGITNDGGTLTVTGSTIANNYAEFSGGGVWTNNATTVTNSTVANNSAGFTGGIHNHGALTVTGSTIAGNSVPAGNVGGIWSSGTVTLANSLVLGNAVTDVSGAYSAAASLVGVPAGYALDQVVAVDGTGNPLLASNGGPTPTIALAPFSPAANAGVAVAGVTTDQRGVARDLLPDVGAYEAGPTDLLNDVGLIVAGLEYAPGLVGPYHDLQAALAAGNNATIKAAVHAFLEASIQAVNTAGSGVDVYTLVGMGGAIARLTDSLGITTPVPPATQVVYIENFVVLAETIPGGLTGGNLLVPYWNAAATAVLEQDNATATAALNNLAVYKVDLLTDPGSPFDLEDDIAIGLAVGELKDALLGQPSVPRETWDRIIADFSTMANNIPGGLKGGDPLVGPFAAASKELTLGNLDATFVALQSFLTGAAGAGSRLTLGQLTALNAAVGDLEALFLPFASRPAPSTTVSASVASPLAGQAVHFTAHVTNSDGSAPVGTVRFYADGIAVGGPVAVGAGGLAVSPDTTLTAGGHVYAAVFTTGGTFPATGAAAGSVTAIAPASVQGLIYVDFNNDGQVDFNEGGVASATVTLTGTDDLGHAVSLTVYTDANGVYRFDNLRPSNGAGYTLTETQPAGYPDGRDTLGTIGGVYVGTAGNDAFSGLVLAGGGAAMNYNFGERPATTGAIGSGQTAGIGFWQNKKGQDLIKSLNGGGTSTQLGNWLAATFPNLYGGLAGKTNAQVAAFYQARFALNGNTAPGGPPKADAQVMATALAVYVTNSTLAGPTATAYGFTVTQYGVGAETFNVGSRGTAFGVANNATVSVMDLLLAVNARSRNGLMYDLDGSGSISSPEATYRTAANDVFSAINGLGGI